ELSISSAHPFLPQACSVLLLSSTRPRVSDVVVLLEHLEDLLRSLPSLHGNRVGNPQLLK
ncbi:unnamed protein product, partial [Allacma fusca]